jgi:hypothetical protein
MSGRLNVSVLENRLYYVLRNEENYREMFYYLEQFIMSTQSTVFIDFMKVLYREIFDPYIPPIESTLDEPDMPYSFSDALIENAMYNRNLNRILHNIVDMFEYSSP